MLLALLAVGGAVLCVLFSVRRHAWRLDALLWASAGSSGRERALAAARQLEARGQHAGRPATAVAVEATTRALVRYSLTRTGADAAPALALVCAADSPNTLESFCELFAGEPKVLAALAGAVCAVVGYEPPGTGFSFPSSSFAHGLDHHVDVLCEFLERLRPVAGVQHFALYFPCGSAFVALAAAARRPDLVAALIVPQCAGPTEQLRWLKRIDVGGMLATPFVGQLVNFAARCRALARSSAPALSAPRARRRLLARKWFEVAVAHRPQREVLARHALQALDAGACWCLASAFQRLPAGVQRGLPAAPQPALSLWGVADRTHRKTRRASCLELSASLRAADVVELPGVGHCPELEAPLQVAERIALFLRARAAGAAQ